MVRALLVSTRKGLFILERDGRGPWSLSRTAFLGDNVTLSMVDRRDGVWYAALNLGHFGVKLQSSTDAGRTWTECAVPAYPEGELVYHWDGKTPDPAALKLIWSLEAGGADQPGRLWAGTLPGGLFRSDDRGQTWDLVRSLWDREERQRWFGGGADHPGVHSICIDPRDSRRVSLAVSSGGVWISEDDGTTWEIGQGLRAEYVPPELAFDPVGQDPHLMVHCAAAPEQCWIQHHNGIFRSHDGGRNWREITQARPSAFGFAVAVHPADPKTAWFVPAIKDEKRYPVEARFVVSRTRDDGETFEILTNGLPQQPAYDIVYRHALAIDDSGEMLAAGSTTGGLWITEDQGDHWTCLSTHLPPIYAVRFSEI